MAVAIDDTTDLEGYSKLLVTAIDAHLRRDLTSVNLGPVRFIAAWERSKRERFLQGMLEALDASLDQNDPTIVEAYVRYMSHADDPVPESLRPGFFDRFAESFAQHAR